MSMYNVNNVSKDFLNHKYSVIRYCDGEYWYYGSCDSLERAQEVCNSLDNGQIVESENIEVMW